MTALARPLTKPSAAKEKIKQAEEKYISTIMNYLGAATVHSRMHQMVIQARENLLNLAPDNELAQVKIGDFAPMFGDPLLNLISLFTDPTVQPTNPKTATIKNQTDNRNKPANPVLALLAAAIHVAEGHTTPDKALRTLKNLIPQERAHNK